MNINLENMKKEKQKNNNYNKIENSSSKLTKESIEYFNKNLIFSGVILLLNPIFNIFYAILPEASTTFGFSAERNKFYLFVPIPAYVVYGLLPTILGVILLLSSRRSFEEDKKIISLLIKDKNSIDSEHSESVFLILNKIVFVIGFILLFFGYYFALHLFSSFSYYGSWYIFTLYQEALNIKFNIGISMLYTTISFLISGFIIFYRPNIKIRENDFIKNKEEKSNKENKKRNIVVKENFKDNLYLWSIFFLLITGDIFIPGVYLGSFTTPLSVNMWILFSLIFIYKKIDKKSKSPILFIESKILYQTIFLISQIQVVWLLCTYLKFIIELGVLWSFWITLLITLSIEYFIWSFYLQLQRKRKNKQGKSKSYWLYIAIIIVAIIWFLLSYYILYIPNYSKFIL